MKRAIVTNVHLKLWKKKESDMCSFCGLSAETIEHLLIECPNVKTLQDEMCEWLKTLFPIIMSNLVFDKTSAIFGWLNVGHKYRIVNAYLMIMRQYIYRQRCLGKKLLIYELKQLIMLIKNSEKYYAIKNNRTVSYQRKWDPDAKKSQDLVDFNIHSYITEYVEDM